MDGKRLEKRGGNGAQRSAHFKARKPHKKLNLSAVGCHRLPFGSHGKEGVDGSSPAEGSAKAPHVGALSFRSICAGSNVLRVWSALWSLQIRSAADSPPLLGVMVTAARPYYSQRP